MKSKPDLLWVLAGLFGLGVLLSTYSQGEVDPEKMAQQTAPTYSQNF